MSHILQAFQIFRLTGLVFIDLNFVLVNKNAKKNCNTYVLVCLVTVGYSGGIVERSSLLKTTNTSPPQGTGVLNKYLYQEAPPRGPTSYPFIYHFSQKKDFFPILLLTNGTLFTYPVYNFASHLTAVNALCFK